MEYRYTHCILKGYLLICILVLRRARRTVVVEVKFSAAPKPAKGFWNALEDLKPQRAFVVAPVRERYPLAGRVQALPVLECSRVFE